MRSGFRRLVHPATSVNEVDIAGTAERRRELHNAFRLRQHLVVLLVAEDIDSPALTIEVGDETTSS